MKDLQKSRALQACRMLVDQFEKSFREPGGFMRMCEISQAVDIARLAVQKTGLKLGDRRQEAHRA